MHPVSLRTPPSPSPPPFPPIVSSLCSNHLSSLSGRRSLLCSPKINCTHIWECARRPAPTRNRGGVGGWDRGEGRRNNQDMKTKRGGGGGGGLLVGAQGLGLHAGWGPLVLMCERLFSSHRRPSRRLIADLRTVFYSFKMTWCFYKNFQPFSELLSCSWFSSST